jgi:hypothetical protein
MIGGNGGAAGDTNTGGMSGEDMGAGGMGTGGMGTGGMGTGGMGIGGTDTGGTDTGGTDTGGRAGMGGAGASNGGAAGTGMGGAGANNGGTGGAGTGGRGGSASCGDTFAVGGDGLVLAPGASGCWHGYAYPGGDVGSVVMPTSFATCGAGCVLRVSGTLGPSVAPNFSGAVFVVFNLNQATSSSTPATVVPAGTALEVTYTKVSGPAAVRLQIHDASTRWCVTLAGSPVTIPYTSFNTACWDNSGSSYAKQPIQGVQLVAPGGSGAQPFDMTLVSVRDI